MTQRSTRTRSRPACLVAFVFLMPASLLLTAGCAASGARLVMQSTADSAAARPVRLETDFPVCLYRFDGTDTATLVLLDRPFGPDPLPSHAVTVRMFWRPAAGRTPIDPDATNITVHHVIFARDTLRAKDELGIYTGAGFLLPLNKPGEDLFKTRILQANLLLDDKTDGFKDLLGPALLTGPINAKRDDRAVDRVLDILNSRVRLGLGRVRLVAAPIHAGPG